MKKEMCIFTIAIALICFVAIIGMAVEFFISSQNNAAFYAAFEKIKLGTSQEEVKNILGNPILGMPAMNSLETFWGNKEVPIKNLKPVKAIYTYEAKGLFFLITGMRSPIWQIGFDEKGNAICKHYY